MNAVRFIAMVGASVLWTGCAAEATDVADTKGASTGTVSSGLERGLGPRCQEALNRVISSALSFRQPCELPAFTPIQTEGEPEPVPVCDWMTPPRAEVCETACLAGFDKSPCSGEGLTDEEIQDGCLLTCINDLRRFGGWTLEVAP